MVFLEILYNIWFGGVIISILHMVSTFVFGDYAWKRKQLFASLWFTAIWPIGLFSPLGRKYLFGKIHQL